MPAAEPGGVQFHTGSLGAVHWVGILAAAVSARVHLLLGVRMLPSGLGASFVLSGVGFLGAVGLVLIGIGTALLAERLVSSERFTRLTAE